MADHFPRTSAPASHPSDRRPIAVGTITRRGGRTTTVLATQAGVAGSIRPTGGAR